MQGKLPGIEYMSGLKKEKIDEATLGSILDEAKAIICGDRREAYGAAQESFGRIADLWSILFDKQIKSSQVALAMILLKVARDTNLHKEDNLVDIAGYAALAAYLASAEDTP